MAKINFKLHVLSALGLFLLMPAGAEGVASRSGEQAKPDWDNGLWRRAPVITIPVTLIHNIPFVSLSVNGHKDELFILDSGAQASMLNSDEATRLKIRLSPKPVGHAKGLGDSAGQPMWMTTKPVKLKFGREVIVKGDMLATSASYCGLTGVKIAGVLGYDVLRAHPTVIDYPHGRFMIFEKDSFIPRVNSHIHELGVDKAAVLPVFTTVLGVDGKDYGDARVVVDTGSDTGTMIYARFAAAHSLSGQAGWKDGKNCGVGGIGSYLRGLPGSAVIGKDRVALPEIAVMVTDVTR
ncbi:MAG: aspartyl protease family protein [Formivibrio sp.]|nr:aspartyl protease family protein [Formivibrio sp.]